jgi:hypothetical protein
LSTEVEERLRRYRAALDSAIDDDLACGVHSNVRGRRPSAVFVGAVAVMAILGLLALDQAWTARSTGRLEVSTDQGLQPQTTEPLRVPEGVVAAYMPPGFTLCSNESGAIGDGPPGQGATSSEVKGQRRTIIYSCGNATRDAGTSNPVRIYVQAEFDPDEDFDLQARKRSKAGLEIFTVDTTVNGKPALFGKSWQGSDGISGFEWVERPHVLVSIIARGQLADEELRSVAESVAIR